MNFKTFLRDEWVQALGCTEPASIAFAGMNAAKHLKGDIKKISLIVDPKIYKNCYAVGIPHSLHKTGLKWATAIGVFLKNTSAGLMCFQEINDDILKKAEQLINIGAISIKIDRKKKDLYISFSVHSSKGSSVCTIEKNHTNITRIVAHKKTVYKGKALASKKGISEARSWAQSLSPEKIVATAKSISAEERGALRNGGLLNLAIANYGKSLLPRSFFDLFERDPLTNISSLVCGGVYARMWGEDYPVMSIAGSGNKGIVTSVPLMLLEKEWNIAPAIIEEALAVALLFTSKTTAELGTLSAVCGCSNAAGIGLACAIVYIKGGGPKEIFFAINNMVGNITGMICDGAKIGCALKTMTSVDSAFRAATLALSGIGIPKEDGIVGCDGTSSLKNMSLVANNGMLRTDDEVLKIMESKL